METEMHAEVKRNLRRVAASYPDRGAPGAFPSAGADSRRPRSPTGAHSAARSRVH